MLEPNERCRQPNDARREWRRSVAIFLLALACSSTSSELPTEPASIAGRVTAVNPGTERASVIRVESNPDDSAGSPKAAVRITESTVIRAPSSASLEPGALRVGQWVRVWFIGPVRESYPVQADAGTIVVDSLGSPP